LEADALVEDGKLPDFLGIDYLGAPESDNDFLLSPTVTDAPVLCNHPAHRVRADGAECLAEVLPPYFNRTLRHYCGHKNTPHNKDSERRAVIIKTESAVYLAHPLARQYYEFGSIYHKRYFMKALSCIYSGNPVRVKGLGSAGRIRTIKQETNSRYCINLTYANPSARGAAEIIEDILPLYDLKFEACLPENIKRIYLPLSGEDIPFEYENGTLNFSLKKLQCHEAIVLEY
jgi:hypothetical protein